MNRDSRRAALILGLLCLVVVGAAHAFDLGSITSSVGRLFGRGSPQGQSPGEPEPQLDAGGGAPADSVDAGLLDEVLLTPEPYYYQSMGRRDPFQSLVGESEDALDPGEELLPRDISISGILWGEKDRFAMVETKLGTNHILREGDRLGRMRVTQIHPDAVTVHASEYGVGKTVRLPLTEWKGKANARG